MFKEESAFFYCSGQCLLGHCREVSDRLLFVTHLSLEHNHSSTLNKKHFKKSNNVIHLRANNLIILRVSWAPSENYFLNYLVSLRYIVIKKIYITLQCFRCSDFGKFYTCLYSNITSRSGHFRLSEK